jgi:hypothetical protein
MLNPERTKTPRTLPIRAPNTPSTEPCAPTNTKSALLHLPEHVLAAAFEKLQSNELAALRLAGREFVAPASAAVRSLKPSSLAGGLGPFRQLRMLDLTGLQQEEWHEGLLETLVQVQWPQ